MALFLSQKFNPRSLASRGEELARLHYRWHGWQIVAQNLANARGKRLGEIDFIALQGKVVRFVEVKTRRSAVDRFGGARFAVPAAKQKKLLKLIKWFLARHPSYQSFRPQIDVCLVEQVSLDKNRFHVTIIPHAVGDDFSR